MVVERLYGEAARSFGSAPPLLFPGRGKYSAGRGLCEGRLRKEGTVAVRRSQKSLAECRLRTN